MGKLDGKIAFVTGAARGQGRSHAIRLAREGADIIAVDLCGQIPSVPYPMSTPEDLAQTVKEVEAEGRQIVAQQGDVRDVESLRAALEVGVSELGPVDIVIANAGIGSLSVSPIDQEWDDALAVNLTGVYNTVRIVIPSLIERGQGGAIVMTSSTGGLAGVPTNASGLLGYTASKHGVVGLVRSWANYLAPYNIRVNSVAPTAVRTPMAVNETTPAVAEAYPELFDAWTNALPVDMVEPIDVSNAVVWLVTDDSRYVTGTVLPVDAGSLNFKGKTGVNRIAG